MIYFFQKSENQFFAVGTKNDLLEKDFDTLSWLFSGAPRMTNDTIEGQFIGPRKEMITPWSTNAVEIAENCGVQGIDRIESFLKTNALLHFDPMLQARYDRLDQHLYTLDIKPEPIVPVEDISAYNDAEGLALSIEEIAFLDSVSAEIGRPLTDSEIFGFSQINSEHCRHKIFNGKFVIDGQEQEKSLFEWIKRTSLEHPNLIVSAYKDNVAFVKGPIVEQFAPKTQDKPDFFEIKDFESVISLKAETHNFPTTVEPFNGAATGAGGEIRDRLAGGQGSFPLAGTAVYMTSYPRTEESRSWEKNRKERKWLYQTPSEILVKASNGASDFGNKYGQPLICGSLLTFEHEENEKIHGFDKVIMLAGGIGFAKRKNAKKQRVEKGEKIIVLGGENYRIGMGGGAVSSVATGEFKNSLELNAVQRSNPEMQKRAANAIRALSELDENPIVSIHDHGAGGHLNCLSELVEESGGKFKLEHFPVGDSTLSDKEILSNESQERMGLVIKEKDMDYLKAVSARERAPMYPVGETTGDFELIFENKDNKNPFELKLTHLFGSSPVTILEDQSKDTRYREIEYSRQQIEICLENILQLEAVASKDWLTNKVDRSVTGKVATQQTVGEIQLPLNNVAVMALDYKSHKGVATSIGHAPVPALVDAGVGSRLSVAEALTNLVFAPLEYGLQGVSLSANWMWPAKNEGENKRLYDAVKELSDFCTALGINIPTGKDSLSMTQKYPDGSSVYSPGTVIISTVGEVSDIRKTVLPNLNTEVSSSCLVYVDFSGGGFGLAGSSFAQSVNRIGNETPDVDNHVLKDAFAAVQHLIKQGQVLAGHDVSAGGLITTLLEMNFPNLVKGLSINVSEFEEKDLVKLLFSERPAVVLQLNSSDSVSHLRSQGINAYTIGKVTDSRMLRIHNNSDFSLELDIDHYRDIWMKSSFLLDQKQTSQKLAKARYSHYKKQPLDYRFPETFTGKLIDLDIDLNRKKDSGIKAAIIREKGVNGDREMAYAMWMAGFDVKDVHMTDLIAGREDLSEVHMIVFVGGFSNSDVLGSAKGWAGSFLYNPKAKAALDTFYAREDTLSLGVCNGCQVMMELEKIYPEQASHPKMHHNDSGKFESAFVNVDVLPNDTVMLGTLSHSKLGIWLAHGEGKFVLPQEESEYAIPLKYSYDEFPGNPNGSSYAAAALASKDGRHLAMMPHLERSIFPWNWAHHEQKLEHEVTPWVEPFVNAKNWIKEKIRF